MAGMTYEICRKHMRGAFAWGPKDCRGASIAAFMEANPSAPAPPPCDYQSLRGALRILDGFNGDYLAWSDHYCAEWGLHRAQYIGDANIVMAQVDQEPFSHIMGVSVSGRVAFKTQRGLALRTGLKVERVWTCRD